MKNIFKLKGFRFNINSLINFSLYALVFLMPLFWLPWSIEFHEFNKQYLLVFLVAVALIAWLFKMIVKQKKFALRRTALDIWIVAFMVIMILSAFFSIDKISSWLGFYGRFSDSLIGMLALIVLYFVVVNNMSVKMIGGGGQREKEQKKSKLLRLDRVYQCFFGASWLVLVVAYFSVFNLWSKIPGLPGVMYLRSFNPVSGSLEGLAMFLVMAMSLTVGLILSSSLQENKKTDLEDTLGEKLLGRKIKRKRRLSRAAKFFHFLFLLASVVLLMIIDFRSAWMTLGLVMLILLVMAFWTRMFREQVNLLTLPIILLLIAGFYWLGLAGKVNFLNDLDRTFILPQEIILDSATARTIAWQSVKEYPILGSGPGTFLADFVKFKPLEFNESRFWNIRFDRSSSHFLEIVSTGGLLGSLSYLFVVMIFLLIGLVFFRRKKLSLLTKTPLSSHRHPILVFPLILAWAALLIGQIVYPQIIVLGFYFWFFMAAGVVVWQGVQGKPFRKVSFAFNRLPEVGLILNVAFLIIIFVLVGIFYLGGRFYWANVKFREPAKSSEELVAKLEKVVNLNHYRESYRRALSQAYLLASWNEANKPEEEQNVQLLQKWAVGAIQQARAATFLSPRLVTAWENLGAVYRDARGLVRGTLSFALEAFAKASELDPYNPFFYRERCRLNLISEEKNWDETISYCQRAIELKPNYLDARLELARALEEKGDLEAAIKETKNALDKLKGTTFQRGSALAMAATEVYFQLGRLYFNLKDMDKAINNFEQAVIITPQYANARYALALSYQAKGRTEDALTQMKIVGQMLPQDENVKQMIKQLEEQLQPQPTTEQPQSNTEKE